ncbi:MAG: DNA repair and recombination protein RadB [Euryarchaeota archaeon]|nr:DNA repair and recombination protein RadB [Euryarchaeota archaeon]
MKVSTRIPSLDSLLEGGLEPGAVTLLYGAPATGKTNLCLQVARQVVRDGLKVAYVDTEGVSLDRLRQVAGEDHKAMMKSVLFSGPRNLKDQERLVDQATAIPDAGLIVVDSINFFYRLELDEDPQAASRSMHAQLGRLSTAARVGRVPAIVTAQVYDADEGVLPFGGRVMGHIVKTILELQRDGSETGGRKAVLRKHRAIAEGGVARFRITEKGLE